MGRSKSVFNKRANEQVQSAQSSGGVGGFIPQAHAQSSQNPTQNQSPQAHTQSTQQDPWARASQFVHNIGRGATDTGRSYTTDIIDTASSIATGKPQEERSYQDETLAGVFGRGLFEGNLEGSWDEAGRRIKEEPGRVVGEVAAEAAILGGTMGFGALLKGAKVGATGIKSIRGAVKADGVVGWKRKTGLIRKGTEEKYIGNKRTTIRTVNRKGVEKFKTKKTNVLDRLERFGTVHGERFSNKIGRPTRLGSPTIMGASGKGAMTGDDMIRANKLVDDNYNTGYMQQYEQFQAGNLGHVSGITKQSGLFEGIAAPARSPTKGVIEFDTQVPRIGGTPDNFSNLKIASLDTANINPQYYKGKDGTYYASKLNDETRPVANKLIKEFTTKIKNNKGLKAARERATKVDMADQREGIVQPVDGVTSMEMMGGSPSSIPINQNAVLKIAKTEIIKTISEGGTEAQAISKVNKIIKHYTRQTVKQDAQVAKEAASAGGDTTATLSSLGTPADDVVSPMVKFNLVEEIRPSVKTDPKTGGLVKVKYDSEPGPIVSGENYGRYSKTAGAFDDANKAMYNMGGTLEKGGAKVKDEQNVGSQMSNRFNTASEYKASLEYFSPVDDADFIQQYNIIRTAKPGAKSAHASEQARQSLPANPDQFMMQMGLSKKQTKDLFFAKGWGGTVEDAQKEVAKSMNRTPQTGSIWNNKPQSTVGSIRARKQTELTQGDMSGIKTDPYPETVGKWTPQQISETGIKAPQFVKDKNARITSPGYYDPKTGKFVREDVESILTAVQFNVAPRKAGPRIFQSVDMRNVGFNIGKTQNTLRNTRYSGATGKPINMNKLRAKGKKAPKPKKLTNEDLLKIRLQSTKKPSKPYTKKKQTVDDIWAMGKQDWSDLGSIGF